MQLSSKVVFSASGVVAITMWLDPLNDPSSLYRKSQVQLMRASYKNNHKTHINNSNHSPFDTKFIWNKRQKILLILIQRLPIKEVSDDKCNGSTPASPTCQAFP